MKLRIENDTLRLRLAEAEVQQFAAAGRVTAATHFGPGAGQQLSYTLERLPPPDREAASAALAAGATLRYAPGQITVLVPAALADEWTSTSRNGFTGELAVTDSRQLRILVEKDLDCRH